MFVQEEIEQFTAIFKRLFVGGWIHLYPQMTFFHMTRVWVVNPWALLLIVREQGLDTTEDRNKKNRQLRPYILNKVNPNIFDVCRMSTKNQPAHNDIRAAKVQSNKPGWSPCRNALPSKHFARDARAPSNLLPRIVQVPTNVAYPNRKLWVHIHR